MNVNETLKKWDSMTFYQKMAVKREIEEKRGADPCLSGILPELLAMQSREQVTAEKAENARIAETKITELQDYIISQAKTQNELFRMAMDLMRRVETLEHSILIVKNGSEGAKLFAPLNDRVI